MDQVIVSSITKTEKGNISFKIEGITVLWQQACFPLAEEISRLLP
jgi:hypothetical protein